MSEFSRIVNKSIKLSVALLVSSFTFESETLIILVVMFVHESYLLNLNLFTSYIPIGHTTLLRRWINVIDVDSMSQQRRVPNGLS